MDELDHLPEPGIDHRLAGAGELDGRRPELLGGSDQLLALLRGELTLLGFIEPIDGPVTVEAIDIAVVCEVHIKMEHLIGGHRLPDIVTTVVRAPQPEVLAAYGSSLQVVAPPCPRLGRWRHFA